MNRETAKALLENGVLQAYADGEAVQVLSIHSKWTESTSYNFDQEPEYYRIKPKLKEGDLVKSLITGVIGTVTAIVPMGVQINHIENSPRYSSTHHPDNLVHVKKVLKPHTFETAVKACAVHGFTLINLQAKELKVITLAQAGIDYIGDGPLTCMANYHPITDWVHLSNETPFAQIAYEEIE